MIFENFPKNPEKMPKSDTFLGIWLYTKCVTFTHDSVDDRMISIQSHDENSSKLNPYLRRLKPSRNA